MPITPITPSGSNAPNDLPSDAAGAVAVPNTLPSDAAGAVAVPNTLPADGAGSVASPVSLPSVAAAAAPRTLTPMVNLDFAAKSYARKGRTVLFDDLLTYTRASSATFINRRIDEDGGYEYFLDNDYVGNVTNLALHSEDFANAAWVKSNASITTSFITSPHGATTVSKLIENSALGVHVSSQEAVSVSAGNYNFSVYMKKAERRYGSIRAVSDSFGKRFGAVIDLDTGIITSTSNFGGAIVSNLKIKPLDNGWFNISVTLTHGAGNIDIAACSSDLPVPTFFGAAPQYTGDGVSGIYVWGAQVTESAKPLPYVKTLASAITQTFTETLRVEYDAATGENLGALIEGASTNLALHSEDFSNAAWVKGDSTILSNEIVAPDDTFSVDKINAATSAIIAPRVSQTITANISSTYTISYYVKKAEASIVQIYFGGSDVANNPRVNFNLITGSIGSQDNDIVSATINPIKNDIYRITATVVAAVATGFTAGIVAIKSTTDTRAQAHAWTIGDGVYVWGAQLEKLPFATSYIRTEGAAVSRSSDNLSLPSAGNFNANEHTLQVDYNSITRSVRQYMLIVSGVTANTALMIGIESDNKLRYRGRLEGADEYLIYSPITTSGAHRAVTTYMNNDVSGYYDGVLVGTASSVLPCANVSDISIGSWVGISSGRYYGHISKVSTYAQALTAQEITLL